MFEDEPELSVIAAVALAESPNKIWWEWLIEAYDKCRNTAVLWGIADALGALDTAWVRENVIEPWIPQVSWAGGRDKNAYLRVEHICYLIQKTSLATDNAREFMGRCLRDGSIEQQGRALRAFGKLQDTKVEEWLLPLCESIVARDLKAIDPNRMKVDTERLKERKLQRAAIETLRDAGGSHSLKVLREARANHLWDAELTILSFQASEEIYSRLTGCLDNESCTQDIRKKPK